MLARMLVLLALAAAAAAEAAAATGAGFAEAAVDAAGDVATGYAEAAPGGLRTQPTPSTAPPTITAVLTPSPTATSSPAGRRVPVTTSTSFSALGRDWWVKDSGGQPVLPGPCVFTPDEHHVWADGAGIHLTVAPVDATCSAWQSTEVWDKAARGYGTYLIRATGPFLDLDPQITVGCFLWDDDSSFSCAEEGAFMASESMCASAVRLSQQERASELQPI